MNAIQNPGYTNKTTNENNINANEMIDFADFSNYKFTDRLVDKYQDRANRNSESLISSLLTIEEGDLDEENEDAGRNTASNNNDNKELNGVCDEINKFTTYIELEKIRFDKTMLDLFIHFNILTKLEKHNVINWHSNTSLFYPIKTIGDGNCLVSHLDS